MLLRLLQPPNADVPMLVRLLPIVMLVRLVQKKNAPLPMLVTGKLLVVSGIITAPPGPVYSWMFSEPSKLVVKRNWARSATGVATTARITQPIQVLRIRDFISARMTPNK